MDNIIYREDSLLDNTLMIYRYVIDPADDINIYNAKICNLGVFQMLKGQCAGQKFMFSLSYNPDNITIQMLVYGYLTYGIIDRGLLDMIQDDEAHLSFLNFISNYADGGKGELFETILSS